MTTTKKRYRGALLGVLTGDALGAPYETWTQARILEDIAARSGLHLFSYPDPWKKDGVFPAGRPTDDSEQTAALGLSLADHTCLDEADVYLRLRNTVFNKESVLWHGPSLGAGKTTRYMLKPERFEDSRMLSTEHAFPSNGSLMRSAPLALFFGSRARVSKDIVERATRITHTHPEAIELTYAYVCILAGLLEGLSVPDALKYTQELSWHSEGLKHLLAHPTEEPRDPEAWPGRGAGLLTLHVALWTLTTTDTFIQGIRQSIVIGGDTDTYAAVAGSFLGALYGEDSIPRTWKDTLLGADVMIDIAERLYVHAHS